MDDRPQRQVTLPEVYSAHSDASVEPLHPLSDEPSQEPQPTLLELNSILLIVMAGVVAFFTAAMFLLCLS